MVKVLFIVSVILVFAGYSNAAMYKWVDKEGNINYGDCPPPECKGQEIKPEVGPSLEETERAQERLKSLKKQQSESEELQKECDEARAAVRQLNQEGPGVLHLQMGGKIIATGKKKDELRMHYEEIIKQKCQ